MTHANARLTVFGRGLIVDRWRSGWRQAHIAAAMGVSRKCVKTWIDRFRVEGQAGLHDRSSRPHRIANRTPLDVEATVVAIRETQRKGRDWIAAEFGIPPRTVSRILARHGVPHLSLLDPMTGQRIRASKITSVRYERAQPGELVHMDVKKLGRIPDGGGWRAHGRSEQVRGRGNGYDAATAMTTCTPWSTTTPAGLLRDPARREGRHLRPVLPTSGRLLRRARHRTHRPGDDRQPPQLQTLQRRAHGDRRHRSQTPVHQTALPMAKRQGL